MSRRAFFMWSCAAALLVQLCRGRSWHEVAEAAAAGVGSVVALVVVAFILDRAGIL